MVVVRYFGTEDQKINTYQLKKKGKVIPLQARCGPAALYPRERPGTHFTGGWVGPRAGLDGGKSRPHRDLFFDSFILFCLT